MESFDRPRRIEIEGEHITRVADAARFQLSVNGREIPLPDGAVILPGLVDAHCHLIGPGQMADMIDLRGCRSVGEVARMIGDEVRARGGRDWITGFGWNQESWPSGDGVTHATLDAVAPDTPVALYRIDTHALWLNGAALRRAGIDARSIDEDGGLIARDASGAPTGIVYEEMVKEVSAMMPAPTAERIAAWYRYGIAECVRHGLTSVHDMTVHPDWLGPLVSIAEAGEMRIKARLFLDGTVDRWRAVPQPGVLGANLEAVGVKYFADGALGSRGAWLLEPYADAPETRGIATMSTAELIDAARAPIEAGYAVATHAIGDAAVRAVLDAYAALRERYPHALLRLEHAQNVHPDDIPRFAALNVIPSVQPIHCTSDAAMAEARLGIARCANAYPWRALRDAGMPLIAGSDFPIESPDPLFGLRAFVERSDARGAWHPEQIISRQEAIDAYTTWVPAGLPGERSEGALREGYAAAITVVSGDPFDDVDARAVMTIVGGELVFSAG